MRYVLFIYERASTTPIVPSATRRGGIGVFERARILVESPSASSCIFLAAWRLVVLETHRQAGFKSPVGRASRLTTSEKWAGHCYWSVIGQADGQTKLSMNPEAWLESLTWPARSDIAALYL